MLLEVFSKDTLKSVFGAYNEFTKAQGEADKMASCDDLGRKLWKNGQKHSRNFFKNVRKEG
jgi:hypothetical protein